MTDEERNALAQLTAAHKRLDEARDITTVMGVHAMASAVEVLVRQARMGVPIINTAQEVKLLCERKVADLVDEGQATGEIATASSGRPVVGSVGNPDTYADLGLSRQDISEFRAIRDTFTEDDIRRLVAAATNLTHPKEVARYQLLRDARYQRAAARKTREGIEDDDLLRRQPPDVTTHVGDFTDVLGDLRDVDAVITDPPYPHEFVPVYGKLARWADEVLAPDGVMVVMTGHMYLPEVFAMLDGHRPYRWTCAYLTPGAHASVWGGRNVMQGWKPLLIYGAGPRVHDVFRSAGDDKGHHYWGQNLGAFVDIVESFTRPGMTVVDPFMGGGTTAAACVQTRRQFIGCDIDPDAVQETRARLADDAARLADDAAQRLADDAAQ